MTRHFTRPIALCATALALSGCIAFLVSSGIDDPDIDGVEVVDQGFVSSYIVDVGEGAWVLIDAGGDAEAEEVLAALDAKGAQPSDLLAILITHGHGDHTKGLAAFPDTPVWAHPGDRDLIAEESECCAMTDELSDGQILTLGDTDFEIFHTPGHTDGSIVILADRVVYWGDNTISTRGGRIREAPHRFSDDVEVNESEVAKMSERLDGRQVDWMLFSHSGSLTGEEGLEALEAFAEDH